VSQTFARALARHFDEPQFGNTRDTNFRVIALHGFFERAQHLAAMFGIFHVDEIDDDDAAEIAHAQLPRERRRRFEISFVNRLFEIAVTDERASVDVDGRHRFGLIDN
jgi:hypothetical protein